MANQTGEGISGVAVVAVFAGGLLAWSGVKGYKLSYVTQDLISGKDPAQDPRVQSSALTVSPGGIFSGLLGPLGSILGLPGSSSSGGTSPTSANVQGGSSGRFGTAFAKSLLATIGAPQTPANISSIQAWARREGGGGTNNPLNTTLGSQPGQPQFPGATKFNSVGVMNYATFADGVVANATVLMQSQYTNIVAALKSGKGLCGLVDQGFLTWSGGGYSSVC